MSLKCKFKKGDLIPAEVVEDRLIRGRKIGLVNSIEVEETKETLNEVVETIKEEILTEDSSDVSIEIKEEDITEENTQNSKSSRKNKGK